MIPYSMGLYLSQSNYIYDLLTKVDMVSSKPFATPMIVSDLHTSANITPISNAMEYRALLGSH